MITQFKSRNNHLILDNCQELQPLEPWSAWFLGDKDKIVPNSYEYYFEPSCPVSPQTSHVLRLTSDRIFLSRWIILVRRQFLSPNIKHAECFVTKNCLSPSDKATRNRPAFTPCLTTHPVGTDACSQLWANAELKLSYFGSWSQDY